MAKFRFTFKDGTDEIRDMSDCATPEDAVNTAFGSNTEGLKDCEIVEEGE